MCLICVVFDIWLMSHERSRVYYLYCDQGASSLWWLHFWELSHVYLYILSMELTYQTFIQYSRGPQLPVSGPVPVRGSFGTGRG